MFECDLIPIFTFQAIENLLLTIFCRYPKSRYFTKIPSKSHYRHNQKGKIDSLKNIKKSENSFSFLNSKIENSNNFLQIKMTEIS